MSNQRKSRIAGAAVLATSLVAAFAALGGIGIAQGAISAVQYQYGHKATICHKGKTISVAKAAVPAHTRHGDTVGACSSAAAKAKHAEAEHAKSKGEHGKAEHAKSKAEHAKAEKPDTGKGHGKSK